MTVLSGQTIRLRHFYPQKSSQFLGIEPFSETKQALGMSYGLSVAGYDIRIGAIDRTERKQKFPSSHPDYTTWVPVQSTLVRPNDFVLLSSLERFRIPNDLIGYVHDKSTLARQGLALQNTVLEPGWEGHITLELSNHGPTAVRILVGQPIAQVVFGLLDQPAEQPYTGKYQNQGAKPVHAIHVEDSE